MFALVDGNNFFVSCERIFRPDLLQKPVAVLSNNDGCIIARSNEVKALGIPMGAPVFKYKAAFTAHNVTLFSSNFMLYGDISRRMMHILSTFSPDFQPYSIDEAFLQFPENTDTEALGQTIKNTLQKQLGIPISIGFGPTKTLAKVANHLAKKQGTGVADIAKENLDELLGSLEARDVWGIGRRMADKLLGYGIRTAKQYRDCDETLLKKLFKTPGLRVQYELKGQACFELEESSSTTQSILSSRSFGQKLSQKEDLASALCNNLHSAAKQLRKQRQCCGGLTVFVMADRFKPTRQVLSAVVTLPEASQSTLVLTQQATQALDKLFIPGLSYAKSGVMLFDLHPEDEHQQHLFEPTKPSDKALMTAMDRINSKFGSKTLGPALRLLHGGRWKTNAQQQSPQYTTDPNDFRSVRID
ncbi:MAG: Y-family DNA polymerase [Candidatus Margulisiibacteriota bacterium]